MKHSQALPALEATLLVLVLSGMAAATGGSATFCNSTPNSTGLEAHVQATGSLSVTANDTSLVVTDCPPGQNGIFLVGDTPITAPFGNGTLCISPLGSGLISLPPILTTDAGGQATRFLDLTALPPGAQITAGSTWLFQFWYRDPAAGGAFHNISDGLKITFCP